MRKRLGAAVFPSKLSHVIKYHGGGSRRGLSAAECFSQRIVTSQQIREEGGLKSLASKRGHNNLVGHCCDSTSVTLTELSPH